MPFFRQDNNGKGVYQHLGGLEDDRKLQVLVTGLVEEDVFSSADRGVGFKQTSVAT